MCDSFVSKNFEATLTMNFNKRNGSCPKVKLSLPLKYASTQSYFFP
jgi:hypothetical protein